MRLNTYNAEGHFKQPSLHLSYIVESDVCFEPRVLLFKLAVQLFFEMRSLNKREKRFLKGEGQSTVEWMREEKCNAIRSEQAGGRGVRKEIQKVKKEISNTGNRTRVTRVTGGYAEPLHHVGLLNAVSTFFWSRQFGNR